MNKRDKRIITELRKLAEDHELESTSHNSRIVAALVAGNTIISYGFNQQKSSPFQARWGKNSESIFWHAETHAVYNALRRFAIEMKSNTYAASVAERLMSMKTTLYVVRVKYASPKEKEMVLGLSAPCPGCRSCLEHYKIDKVVFSLDCDDPADMEVGYWYPNKEKE